MSLAAYVKRNWVNGGAPAINGANLDAMDTAIKNVTDEVISRPGLSGWMSMGGSWAYLSGSGHSFVIRANGFDASAIIAPGARLRCDQGAANKYFIVTAVNYSGTYTDITLYGGTDYTLANAPCNNVVVSMFKAPLGFPLDPTKWEERFSLTTQAGVGNPVQGTWYNLGSALLLVPVGAWDLSYDTCHSAYRGAAGPILGQCTLATNGGTGESDINFTARWDGDPGATARLSFPIHRGKPVILTADTTFYILYKVDTAGLVDMYSIATSYITARCLYL